MNPFYRFCRRLVRIWLWLSGTEYIGLEHIPADQAVLIAANHNSLGDPPMVGCAFPYQVFFLGKEELGQNPLLRKVFAALGTVFLKRGEADLAALRKALVMLKENKAVGIFPEGHRYEGDEIVGEFKQGVTFIAYRAKVKIIPVATINAGDILRFWKRDKKVVIGPPIEIEAGQCTSGEVLDKYTELLRHTIKEMLLEHQPHKALPSGEKQA